MIKVLAFNIVGLYFLAVANNFEALLVLQVLALETELLAPFLEQVIRKYLVYKYVYQMVKAAISSTFKEFPLQDMVPTLYKRMDVRVK